MLFRGSWLGLQQQWVERGGTRAFRRGAAASLAAWLPLAVALGSSKKQRRQLRRHQQQQQCHQLRPALHHARLLLPPTLSAERTAT